MLKLLEFLFGTSFGRFILTVIICGGLVGAVKFGIAEHDRRIQEEATAVYNQHQMELIQEDQKKLAQKLQELGNLANQINDGLTQTQQQLDKQATDTQKSVDNNKTVNQTKDKAASPYLQETVRQIGKWTK